MKILLDSLSENPIIAAIKSVRDIDVVLERDVKVVFLLCGNILNMKSIVAAIKNSGKKVFAHIDLVEGLGKDEYAVKYLKLVGVDGIITTKPTMIKCIKNEGLIAVQRIFLLDSRSLETGIKNILEDKPNAVEIMPGLSHKVIKKIHENVKIPVIAGGLILDKIDIENAISNGAVGISTSCKDLW
ncbi:Glycerol-3-phosphate responsive antiterminator [Caloramator mitchellensis]|uniref:Glycerol-3-phosphate responsive antiterminator n=1 Tax=Caloramator mitchellensis TaxID=908809 RepID=A0A0R3JVG2_CALMK|nr:glycerol-3-phosphate responsive antiterminator [Caloramator mitchellensis]KRQ86285.1 Glycerol-3-phosphate responsive antiterminator [Caloramator mitchellensis]